MTIINRGHFSCLPSISVVCSAFAGKHLASRSLLLSSGLLATLQSQLTMDKARFWEGILDVFADCAALFGGSPEEAQLFVRHVKPPSVSFIAALEVSRGGPAAWSALNLLSNLIGLCGYDGLDGMDLDPVFRALLRKAADLDCKVKQAGMALAFNVIWCGHKDLVNRLFDSGLMMTLGEVLSTEAEQTALTFAMETMEKHIQRKGLSGRETEFIHAVFVPFLQECLERDEEAVVAHAESLLRRFSDEYAQSEMK
jgi:hypothetical protein